MRRRTTILYAVLLLVPTLLVGLVLTHLLTHERERLARAGTLAAEEQTRAVANQILVTLDGFESDISRQLSMWSTLPVTNLATQLQAWEKRDPLIRNAFIVSANNRVILPDAADGLTGEEHAFLLRFEPLFAGRATWEPPHPEGAAPTPQRFLMTQNMKSVSQRQQGAYEAPQEPRQGWLPWFEGRNLYLLAWVQRANGLRYGVEVEMNGLLARLITAFPERVSVGQTLTLLDGQGAVVHSVGATEFRPSRPRLAAISLAPALPHWQLVAAGAGAATDSTRGLLFLLAAILCGILLLAILGGGWLLLRDAHRSAIEASTRTTFVANVSHELKTPLTTIRMYAELLSEGRARDESRRAHYLDVIVQESQRLTRLINNVLDFSRLEQGRKTYRPEDFDLAAETRRIVEAQSRRLQAAGLAVELEGTDTACPAHADRDAFEQALLNVLDNAAKYGVSGKRLLVRVACADSMACVRVCDWGPGVPAAHRVRLFQQFQRADDTLTARQPGCGLGLSISRRLLRDQGGDLRYETADSGGACFVLTLPASKGELIGQ